MTLFTPDLYRNFGFGFFAGAVLVALNSGALVLDAVPQLIASIF